jgi:hypothetical protein
MPRAVYLFDESNAFVFNRCWFLGRGLGLGLAFFEALTVGELRAVVAHEFGHSAKRTVRSTRCDERHWVCTATRTRKSSSPEASRAVPVTRALE